MEARARLRQRTYWHLEAERRVPTAYDIGTSRLLYYPSRGFEVKTPVAEWYRRYQSGSSLALDGLARFRDPRETTYAAYVALARDREAFVDGLLRSAAASDYDAGLSDAWLARLERWLPVVLYPCHGLQMVTAYVAQLAPESRVVVALCFQTGDEIRRIQRFAQRVSDLAARRPGFGRAARAQWEGEPAWQPLRRVIEELLVTYDLGEALVKHLLVVKPFFDTLFLRSAGRLAESERDSLLGALCRSLLEDTLWHETVSVELGRVLTAESEQNAALMRGWAAEARDGMRLALGALEPLWDYPGEPFSAVVSAADARVVRGCRDAGFVLEEGVP